MTDSSSPGRAKIRPAAGADEAEGQAEAQVKARRQAKAKLRTMKSAKETNGARIVMAIATIP